MTFDQTVEAYGGYLLRRGRQEDDPRAMILQFLEWDDADDRQFAQDVRIMLASADFSRELTSSVLWLNERDLDIQCVRLTPYKLDGRLLVEVQAFIPLPEMDDYLVQVREKAQKERQARASAIDFTHFDVHIGDKQYPGLTKRHAILRIFCHLCENDISPEDIAALVPRSQQRVIHTLEGDLDAAEFRISASASGVQCNELRSSPLVL
jgi:hypothetical protein